MKRFITILSALILLQSVGTVAQAGLDPTDPDGRMDISYLAPVSYTVIVPANFGIDAEALAGEATLMVKDVRIPDNKTLTVYMTSANGYAMENGESRIEYTVTPEEGTALTGADPCIILRIAAGTTDGSVKLNFETTADKVDAATAAGRHTDILTFTCSVEDVE